MNLYTSITQRKSCRKYDMQPLGQEMLSKIDEMIKSFAPLYPDLPLTYRFSQKVKGRFQVEAPHYLIIGGKGTPGASENVGFVFEQLVLWLDAMEIGSVWLGASKDAEASDPGSDLITIGFGRPADAVHRIREEFKRRPIDETTNRPDDVCMQAVHLAPSGMNTQPWYLEVQGEQVLVYKQKLKPPISLLYKHSDIDMGIGLCHYALACKETGKPFHFSRETDMPDKTGYLSFGIIA